MLNRICGIYKNYKEKIGNKLFAGFRKRKVNNLDFTIISNNCWGGKLYRFLGLPYLSPTVGLYFYAKDYLKFICNLEYYLSCKLVFINVGDSKHRESLLSKHQERVPIGRLDDVEVIFLHYKSEDEAKEKWERRVDRMNMDNLIIKFSEMNECSDEELIRFEALSYEKKFMFVKTPDKQRMFSSGIYFPGYENEGGIVNDTNKWNKYIDVFRLINSNVYGKE